MRIAWGSTTITVLKLILPKDPKTDDATGSLGYVPAKGEITWSKEKSKQNRTRDIEVKNNLTIAIGEGGDRGAKGFQELL